MTPPAPSMIVAHPDAPDSGFKAIGYWRPDPRQTESIREMDRMLQYLGHAVPDRSPDNALPWPQDFVDGSWDPAERDVVLRYLDRLSPYDESHVLYRWRGFSTCRICGKMNGSVCLSDGTFVWPEGFAHYLRDHAVRPDAEFVEHCRDRLARLPQDPVGDMFCRVRDTLRGRSGG